MKIKLTRDSVCAADDVNAPHNSEINIKDTSNIESIVIAIHDFNYLPIIQGGKATWSIESKNIIAVAAQKWNKPKIIHSIISKDDLNIIDGNVIVHINYHAQQDPNTVYEVLECLKIK